MSRPNILLILTDQQRWDSLGCYGTPGVHTPNLDQFAASGIRYDHCYVNNPLCTPSRASLWTGKHLPGHGVYALHDVLPQEEVLFPYRLREMGYDTALFGKLHVAGHNFEKNHRHVYDGFNHYEWCPDPNGYRGDDNAYWRWLAIHHPDVLKRIDEHRGNVGHIPKEAHLTTWSANRTVDYLQSMVGTHRPFFCCMSVFDPHSPYTNYPREYRDLLNQDALPPIVGLDEPFDHRPIAHREERSQKSGSFKAPEGLIESRIGYHAAIALIDEQVGRVLSALESTGFSENTIVIFVSDHGDMLGDHGLTVKGCFMYDACTRVPLLIRNPHGPEGEVIASPCQLHDIAGTILSLAGCEEADIADWMPDSRSLLAPESLETRGYAACMHRNSGVGSNSYFNPPLHATMWREGSYKLSVYHSPDPGSDHCPGELFHMEDDPDELNNLWDDPNHRNHRDSLILKLTNWLVRQETQGRARGGQALPPNFGSAGSRQ